MKRAPALIRSNSAGKRGSSVKYRLNDESGRFAKSLWNLLDRGDGTQFIHHGNFKNRRPLIQGYRITKMTW